MKNQHVEVAGESNINEIQKNAVKSLEEEGFTCTVSIKGKTVKKTIPFENAVKELSEKNTALEARITTLEAA